jgi:acid phosphatase type 7
MGAASGRAGSLALRAGGALLVAVASACAPGCGQKAAEGAGIPVVAPSKSTPCKMPRHLADGEYGLRRWPYLNAMTPDSVVVMFGMSARSEDRKPRPAFVEAESPTGEIVKVSAESVRTPLPGEGHLQLYSARLFGLKPATEYCYSVHSLGGVLASGFKFRTAPAQTYLPGETGADTPTTGSAQAAPAKTAPTTDAPVKFLVLGDFGDNTDDQREVSAQMEKVIAAGGADLLLTTGDNAYSYGTWREWQDNVFDIQREEWAQVPIFPVSGNHDYGTEDLKPYLTNFSLPDNAMRPEHHERYYSFDWGPVHFVMLDSERPLLEAEEERTAGDQIEWLEADLKASRAPWKVALWHRPAYTYCKTHKGWKPARDLFLPILEKYGVQLALTGHNHIYERFPALKRNLGDARGFTATPTTLGGVVHITTGGGGRHLYDILPDAEAPGRLVGKSVFHFVQGTVSGCELTLVAYDKAGAEFDRTVINRCP